MGAFAFIMMATGSRLADSLLAKKQLIEALTRRLFNHVEHGLNVPSGRLDEARAAYDSETDPQRKRVKAGMLAGALFNRAEVVFTKLVDLQAHGVIVKPDNELMRQCGEHLQEALTLGKLVMHRSGDEGIDELWGEPFKAFAYPTDPDIFEIWTSFAVSGETLCNYHPQLFAVVGPSEQQWAMEGMKLIREGRRLIEYITRARVPMPKSTREFIERCELYRSECVVILASDRSVA